MDSLPTGHFAYGQYAYLPDIMPTGHFAYGHFAYWTSDIMPTAIMATDILQCLKATVKLFQLDTL